ncbi:Siderophore synthetase component [Halobacillus dabanensis]|uniref:Siderophore synthetase component n=1 Tax=Halobacillus dabanensis TaxID=240302 RepID=A0A1I3TFP0_HALDA|nr:IucA/IucC family protein [Halobacillus dabanensis]SFJ68287.1 Siderophore synthetase component [Halobacillus dabanensis]
MTSVTEHFNGTIPGPMLEEERCIRFLESEHPGLVTRFLEKREEGRKGILNKLADSVLRENIDGHYVQSHTVEKKNGITLVDGHPMPWSGIYKNLSTLLLKEYPTYKLVLKPGYGILFPIKKESAFQLVETGAPLWIGESDVWEISSAAELVYWLFRTEDYKNRDKFIEELNNGTVNLTLAYSFHEEWKENIQREAEQIGVRNSLDYVDHKRSTGFSPSLFFEQMVVEGHHLHPGAKTKLGLSYDNVVRYSPEFHQTFPIRLVAVRCKDMVTTDQTFEDYFIDISQKARRELEALGYSSDTYIILPVHPWQYEYEIQVLYKEEIESEAIVLLSETRIPAEATSSFRTLAPKQAGAPVLKLAVNSQMTSTVRSISPQTALNSSVFSLMMEDILQEEPQFSMFIPLNEWAGAAFQSSDSLKSRNLTMLVREAVDEKVGEDEIAIAGMSLYAESPVSGKPVLHEVVDQFADTEKLLPAEASLQFFKDYVEKVLPGYLTLMVKYGVALEGHLQNSVPVFRKGRLCKFFFRDWGGARIYTERLRNQGLQPKFAADSVSVTNQRSDMHNKLYYTVFQNHFGEMICQLVSYSGVNESSFWKVVKSVCEDVLDRLSQQEDIASQVEEDREFLYQGTVMHKSLTKMRLTDSRGYGYNEVPNPLA